MNAYRYTDGDRAELVVGEHAIPVTVVSHWTRDNFYTVEAGGGREFAVSGDALRPVLPDDFEMKDDAGDNVRVSCVEYDDGKHRVRVKAETVDLTPDQVDQLREGLYGAVRAIRGREPR